MTTLTDELIPFEKLLVATIVEGDIEIANDMYLCVIYPGGDISKNIFYIRSPHFECTIEIKDAADLRDFFNRYDLPMVTI